MTVSYHRTTRNRVLQIRSQEPLIWSINYFCASTGTTKIPGNALVDEQYLDPLVKCIIGPAQQCSLVSDASAQFLDTLCSRLLRAVANTIYLLESIGVAPGKVDHQGKYWW